MTQEWSVTGTYFEACNCNAACPCVFLSPPTEGECTALVGWHIEKGYVGDTKLDGLNVAMYVHSPGNMINGNWKAALYLDEKASQAQYFPRVSLERVGNQLLVQYGDEILQLIELQKTLPERRKEARNPSVRLQDDTVPVIVCTVNGRRVGLVAHRIVDIVDEVLKARRPGSRDGVRNCAVIHERVTEILDLEALIRLSDPAFFERPTEQE